MHVCQLKTRLDNMRTQYSSQKAKQMISLMDSELVKTIDILTEELGEK